MFLNFKSNRTVLYILTFTALLTGCATNTTIVNNVGEREANEIVVLLNSKGIPAEKIPATVSGIGGGTSSQSMWDITVPAAQVTEAIAILNQAGLPRTKATTLLDLFGSQGLVPSDLQDRIRYQEGLSEQLASTIRKMDGIIDANVQITFPQEEETHKEMTASVYVKHRGVLDNPNSLLITKIKRLVSSAVPGLSIENVTVVADRAIYADISLDRPEINSEEAVGYVSIWSIWIAKNSVNRFRFVFYTFLIFIFLLFCALAWMSWKFFPLLKQGGAKYFFNKHQYSIPPSSEPLADMQENVVEEEHDEDES